MNFLPGKDNLAFEISTKVFVGRRVLAVAGGIVELVEVDGLVSFFLNDRNGTERIFWYGTFHYTTFSLRLLMLFRIWPIFSFSSNNSSPGIDIENLFNLIKYAS